MQSVVRMLPVHSWQSRQDCFRLVARIQGFDSRSVLCTYVMWEQVYTGPLFAFWDYDCFQKHKQELEYVALFLLNRHSGRFESTTFVFGGGITSIRLSPIEFVFLVLFFENKDIFVCSFYYSTCKFDRANDEFDRTRRFETSYNCYHQERFQILVLHRLEQHRRILLSKETYRTLAQPADPCGNHFGDMTWKIPNPTSRCG